VNKTDDIVFLYNYTGTLGPNKFLTVSVLQKDCVSPGTAEPLPVIQTNVLDELYLELDVNLDVIKESAFYTEFSAEASEIAFCVRVDYSYVDFFNETVSVNFHETTVEIGVNLVANFTLTTISSAVKLGLDVQINDAVNCDIYSYFCDENFTNIGTPLYSVGDVLTGCVAVLPDQQNLCQVEGITDMDVDQNELHFDIIKNGEPDPFTQVDCCAGSMCTLACMFC